MNKERSGHQSSRNEGPHKEQQQIDLIKRAVRDTFHAMKDIETKISDLQKVRASLKHDLIDLKEGRIDKLVHRQDIDTVSKENGVFVVKQKIEVGGKQSSQWYIPYYIIFRDEERSDITINNSLAKTHAGGACQLDDGEVKYL